MSRSGSPEMIPDRQGAQGWPGAETGFWRRPDIPPLLLILFVAATAPVMGRLRDFLFGTFAGRAVAVLSAALAALGGALLLVAIFRIREKRWLRYGGLVAVVLLVWLQAIGFRSPLATVNVAEKIHLVEYGALAWLVYRARLPRRRRHGLDLLLVPLVWVALGGLLDEGVQWWVETRTGEIRDVALNLASGAIGVLFALCLEPPEALRRGLDQPRRLLRGLAWVVLAGAGFFYCVHLGYWIDDPEIGRFRSWHSAEGLKKAAAERAELWAEDPPGELSPWNREDRFLTEAGWHNLHRNSSFEHELWGLAHQANRILEKYYTPYLDLESFRQTGDRRYPPHALKRLEEAPPVDPAKYTSPVLESRIVTWPGKPLFLAIVLPVVLLLFRWSRDRRDGDRSGGD